MCAYIYVIKLKAKQQLQRKRQSNYKYDQQTHAKKVPKHRKYRCEMLQAHAHARTYTHTAKITQIRFLWLHRILGAAMIKVLKNFLLRNNDVIILSTQLYRFSNASALNLVLFGDNISNHNNKTVATTSATHKYC